MQAFLNTIIENPALHGKWLNTLSMMENVGAKKIKNCEHPVFVSEIILKHSAEEARHAYYLKRQIQKIDKKACPTYERTYLLAPYHSYAYLHQLDVDVCRYLKATYDFNAEQLKYAAYLLVTYAIEVRADLLYPEYEKALKAHNSNVSVRTIITEEEHHLEEMISQLKNFSPHWEQICADVRAFEDKLYQVWIQQVSAEVSSVTPA